MNNQPTTASLPPGPKGWPIIGSIPAIMNDTHLAMNKIAQEHGDICHILLGNVDTIVISHPDLLREAFAMPALSDKWMGEVMSLFTHNGRALGTAPYGDYWRQLQRIVNRHMLTVKRMQYLRVAHMEEEVEGMLAAFGEQGQHGQLVDPYPIFSHTNARIVFRSVFGRSQDDSDELEETADELLQTISTMFRYATAPNPGDFLPWLKFIPLPLIKEVKQQVARRDQITHYLIDRAKSRPDLDLENPSTLLEVLLAQEKAGEISADSMALLIGDMFLGGTDTSAQTMTWLLLLLANRPEIQAKVHEELDRVIGSDATPTLEDREQLPYTNAVILESMRFRTIAPIAAPHQASESIEIGGYLIPKGAQVLGNLYGIHHDSRFWEAPHEFMPDRFMPQADGSPSLASQSSAYMPFGTGRRACPGYRFGEWVVWLQASRLLHRYQFTRSGDEIGQLSEDEVFGMTVSPRRFSLLVTER